jgi:hypothetical protein
VIDPRDNSPNSDHQQIHFHHAAVFVNGSYIAATGHGIPDLISGYIELEFSIYVVPKFAFPGVWETARSPIHLRRSRDDEFRNLGVGGEYSGWAAR